MKESVAVSLDNEAQEAIEIHAIEKMPIVGVPHGNIAKSTKCTEYIKRDVGCSRYVDLIGNTLRLLTCGNFKVSSIYQDDEVLCAVDADRDAEMYMVHGQAMFRHVVRCMLRAATMPFDVCTDELHIGGVSYFGLAVPRIGAKTEHGIVRPGLHDAQSLVNVLWCMVQAGLDPTAGDPYNDNTVRNVVDIATKYSHISKRSGRVYLSFTGLFTKLSDEDAAEIWKRVRKTLKRLGYKPLNK